MTTNDINFEEIKTALQHCGCNKAHSSWEHPQPTRIGYCSWCWSDLEFIRNRGK